MNETAPNKKRFNLLDSLGLFARGFAMGAADVVPGVSGGTIALITGVYERFVEALGSISLSFVPPLVRGRAPSAAREIGKMHWDVLIPLPMGVMFAVITMSGLITGLMDSKPGPTFAFFFGLIAASSWVPFARMRERDLRHVLALVVAAIACFFLVGASPLAPSLAVVSGDASSGEVIYAGKARSAHIIASVRSVTDGAGGEPAQITLFDPHGSLGHATDEELAGVSVIRTETDLRTWMDANPEALVLAAKQAPLWLLCIYGAIAICAMILPGVSGSFLMLMLGQYHAILSAISRTAHRGKMVFGGEADPLVDLAGVSLGSDLVLIGVFNVGVVVGIATFSRFVAWMLRSAHDVTMAALTGLMIGALRQPAEVMIDASRTDPNAWVSMAGTLIAGAMIVTALNLVDSRARREGRIGDEI